MNEQATTNRQRPALRRVLRWVGAIAVVLAALLVVLLILLSVSPVRNSLLSFALSRASSALPGNISVGDASWPSPGAITMTDVRWTDDGDTLFVATRLSLSVKLFALARKDIVIEEIVVEQAAVDIPAITQRFPSTPSEDPQDKEPPPAAFPRSGSIPGLPSLAIGRVSITAVTVRLDDGNEIIDLSLDGGCDLTADDPPRVHVQNLSARGSANSWAVDSLHLDLDPMGGRVQGHGAGRLSPQAPLTLSIVSHAPDSVGVVVTGDDERASENPALEIRARFERHGLRVRSLRFEATARIPGTSDLSRFPLLAPYIEPLPSLDGITLDAQGSLWIHPALSASITCDIGGSSWLERGHAVIAYKENVLSVDDVALELVDLSLHGSLRLSADSLVSSARARVDGPRTLRLLRPGLTLPGGFVADVAADVAMSKQERKLAAVIEARGEAEGFEIERLLVDADLSLDVQRPSSFGVVVQTLGFAIGVVGDIDRTRDIKAQITPIVVRNEPITPSELRQTHALSGTIEYSTTSRAGTVQNVHMSGVAGDVRIDAHIDSTLAGEYGLACRWTQPPPLLIDALDLSQAQTDSLHAIWPIGRVFELELAGSSTGGNPPTTTTSGRFILPGPRTLDALLPSSMHFEDLGPLEGSLALTTWPEDGALQMDLIADLDSTSWVDSSLIHIGHSGNTIDIDTLGIATRQLQVGMSGQIVGDRYDLSTVIEVVDSSMIRRFAPDAPDVLLSLRADIAGPKDNPDLSADIKASVSGDGYRIPKVVANINMDSRGASVFVDTPHGLTTSLVDLDSLSIGYESTNGLLPAHIQLRARGPGLEFGQSLVADTTDGFSAVVDAFDLVIAGRDLRAKGPFRIAQTPGGVVVEDIDLAGSIGTAQLTGNLGAPSTDIRADIAITFPDEPPSINLPEHLWPERLAVEFTALDNDVDADIDLKGFSLAHGLRSTLQIDIHGDTDTLACHVLIADSLSSLVDARVVLPATVSVYPPKLDIRNGALQVDAVVQSAPLSVYFLGDNTEIPDDIVARLDGRITLRGTTESPVGNANVSVSFPDWPKVSVYELALEAQLGREQSAAKGHSELFTRALADLGDASTSNLILALSLRENGNSVMYGAVGHPATLSFQPIGLRTPEGGRLRAIFRSKDLPAEKFDPILPADVSVKGLAKFDFTADGPAGDPKLDGRFDMNQLSVSVARQARILANGTVTIQGTADAPVVKGNITIRNGVIQVPEDLQQLHPVEGKALLLADRVDKDTPAEPPDSLVQGPQLPDSVGAGEVDITIDIPSQFFVRGRGLDLELAGALQIRKRGGTPMVTGELRAIQATLVFLGRSFRLERGTVTFLGGDEINPAFDVALSTRVGETLVKIIVAGTAQKPQMILMSEPDMQEGDIISLLLFGTSFNDLSDDQAGLVQSRTTEMAAALGAAELQKNISGVDVVQFRGADEQDKSSTLQFGKYLSPSVLLSYVYSLDDQSGSFVSLEYFLKGNLNVNTVYGKRNQTGLGIGWMKDY